MTTNTANSQAASIDDAPEFRQLLRSCLNSTAGDYRHRRDEVVAYIDAKLAQAHLEKQVAEMAAEVEARDRDEWRDRANVLEYRLGEVMEKRDELQARTTAAESRLAEIQRGVEGLTRWRITGDYIGDPVEFITHPEGELVYLKYVLALLAPQGQSDTSGLPG